MSLPDGRRDAKSRRTGASDRIFAAIPVNAIRDTRLSAVHWRVLAAIARADSFGSNGRHCDATQSHIADQANTSRESVSRAAGDLERWRYIETEKRGRRVVYRVLYSGRTCDESVTHQGRRPVTNPSRACDRSITDKCDRSITQNEKSLNQNHESYSARPRRPARKSREQEIEDHNADVGERFISGGNDA